MMFSLGSLVICLRIAVAEVVILPMASNAGETYVEKKVSIDTISMHRKTTCVQIFFTYNRKEAVSNFVKRYFLPLKTYE